MVDLLIPNSGLRELTIEEVLRRKALIDARLPDGGVSSNDSSVSPVSSSSVDTGFSLERLAFGYRLRNVAHRGTRYDMDWSGSLLPGAGKGAFMRLAQDDWYSVDSYRAVGGVVFDVPSAPEYASTILALYRHSDTNDAMQQKLLVEFKDLLAEDFASYMMTSTRTTYTKKGDDIVEHCRGRKSGRYVLRGPIAGASKQLDASMSLETETLFGVDDPQEFMDAVKWLTGKDVIVLGRNTKEKKSFERVLMLDVDNDGFNIDAFIGIEYARPARGVHVREIAAPSNNEVARYG